MLTRDKNLAAQEPACIAAMPLLKGSTGLPLPAGFEASAGPVPARGPPQALVPAAAAWAQHYMAADPAAAQPAEAVQAAAAQPAADPAVVDAIGAVEGAAGHGGPPSSASPPVRLCERVSMALSPGHRPLHHETCHITLLSRSAERRMCLKKLLKSSGPSTAAG